MMYSSAGANIGRYGVRYVCRRQQLTSKCAAAPGIFPDMDEIFYIWRDTALLAWFSSELGLFTIYYLYNIFFLPSLKLFLFKIYSVNQYSLG